jgi:endonuclease/exonuclease/phosphatase family metal-dependent hydrolase
MVARIRSVRRGALLALLRRTLAIVLFAAAPAFATQPLKVMTYNILHGQPCSGGSLGNEVTPRMELAVQGGPGHEPGLVDLAPDILGMQEVSQVFVTQPVDANQACAVLNLLPPPIGGLPPGVIAIEAYEHAGDTLVRRMNGVSAARAGTALDPAASPYKMRFVRDNPRVVPLLPDIPLPPDEMSLSDHAAALGDLEIGLAVISKLRIQQVTVHNLTIGEVPGETRALLHATLRDDASGKAYDFYDSHLTTTGGDSPQTILMAAEIARFILTTRRHAENPGFFTCDCNATPDSVTHQLFTAAGFVDSFAVAHPGDTTTSTSGRDGLSTACSPPLGDGRIDYVWALPDSAGQIPTVLSSEVVMDYKTEISSGVCRFPSDHDGVITTFDLE